MRFRQMNPIFVRKSNRRILNLADYSSDNTSSDEEPATSSHNRQPRRNSEPVSTTNTNSFSRNPTAILPTINNTYVSNSNPNISAGNTANSSSAVRNFNTELEQLVTSLLNEIERNDGDTNRPNPDSTNSHETTQTQRNDTTVVGKF